MNILIISDLHGRTTWKEATVNEYDHIVFLGDYTDSYDVSDETIYRNLVDIVRLKQRRPNQFTLLIGNHDAQYLHFPHYRCSGFRPQAQPSLSTLFTKHEKLFQVAYQQGPYLFSHAGLSNRWLNRLVAHTGHNRSDVTPAFGLADLLNQIHRQPLRTRNILFEAGPERGGFDPCSGPVWADRNETKNDYLAGFHQVVGHTPIPSFRTFGDAAGSITYTDVLETQTEFFTIHID